MLSAYKDKKKGTWYVAFYYTSWNGERLKKFKRGFKTKKEAIKWESDFIMQQNANLNMTFRTFVDLYYKDKKDRLKLNTWIGKQSLIEKKLIPYFGKMKMNNILARDVIRWQNKMISSRNSKGEPYSQTYLKTIHNQLSAIMNHAVRFYDLKSNVAKWISKATKMSERNVYRYEKLASQPEEVQEAVNNGEISVKEAIGETQIKKSGPRKSVDINKIVKKVYELISKLDDELKDNDNKVLDNKSTEHLKESVITIKRMLD